ncbi:alpha/beta hydrolase [Smaragdicoccus niigatensis]|uniref:alpha/beta hydrolase n=1 Tax=Smaragdicoccus niigatensis TaxID=359359 RepID=UPI00035CFBA3|nr:alpha/beta hydrolase family protein [Smaragdicoccus niigatensis]
MVGKWITRSTVAAALIVAAQLTAFPTAPVSAAGASVTSFKQLSGRAVQLTIDSPAMGRPVRVDVIRANPTGTAPTLYLLDGTGARDDQQASSWLLRTDVDAFTADKNVNVVMPVGGGGTLYTDWQKDDPTLGHLKWETFLTHELPAIIDGADAGHYGGSGRNAIAGLSAGGMAAASLAVRFPSLYQAVGSYSTCLFFTNPAGQAIVRGSVISRGGNPTNMWGPVTDPDWPAHDPARHLDKLKGKPFYVSVGSGVPGPLDLNFDPSYSFPTDLAGAIAQEQGAADCTKTFQIKARLAGVTGTFRYNLIGTHSWPYWQIALHDSWATLKRGLGL